MEKLSWAEKAAARILRVLDVAGSVDELARIMYEEQCAEAKRLAIVPPVWPTGLSFPDPGVEE